MYLWVKGLYVSTYCRSTASSLAILGGGCTVSSSGRLAACYALAAPDIPPVQVSSLREMYPFIKSDSSAFSTNSVFNTTDSDDESEGICSAFSTLDDVGVNETSLRWFAMRIIHKRNPTAFVYEHAWQGANGREGVAPTSILGNGLTYESTPLAHPTLTVWTDWPLPQGAHRSVEALVDTGCNTSLIQQDVLQQVVEGQSKDFRTVSLPKLISLMTASGGCVHAAQSAVLTFCIHRATISHSFYVMDSLPIPQKVILGMDFLTIG